MAPLKSYLKRGGMVPKAETLFPDMAGNGHKKTVCLTWVNPERQRKWEPCIAKGGVNGLDAPPGLKEGAMIALAESMILIAVMVLTVCVIHIVRCLWKQ